MKDCNWRARSLRLAMTRAHSLSYSHSTPDSLTSSNLSCTMQWSLSLSTSSSSSCLERPELPATSVILVQAGHQALHLPLLHMSCNAFADKHELLQVCYRPEQNDGWGGHDMSIVLLNNATIFSSSEENAKRVVMTADSSLKNPTIAPLIHLQSFSRFGKKVLSAYWVLHTEMYIMLQQYLEAMHIFSYDAKNKRGMRKRSSEGRLKKLVRSSALLLGIRRRLCSPQPLSFNSC